MFFQCLKPFFFFVVILRFLNILILSFFFFFGKCKGLLYKTLSFSSRFSSKFQPGTISCLLHVSWSAKRQWRHHCDVKSLIISHLINLLSFNSKEKSFLTKVQLYQHCWFTIYIYFVRFTFSEWYAQISFCIEREILFTVFGKLNNSHFVSLNTWIMFNIHVLAKFKISHYRLAAEKYMNAIYSDPCNL